MYILHFGISITKIKTKSFKLMPFILIKVITINEDSKFSK
jgi:hypothetical protein